MSRGKYSLAEKPKGKEYKFNCYGKTPEPWKGGSEYDSLTMFDNYDDEGFDKYGYSAFDNDGNFVGHGSGVDRAGYTEEDYGSLEDLSADERESYYARY